MDFALEHSWKNALKDELSLPYFVTLQERARLAYLNGTEVYPPPKFVFHAFALCPFENVRVVILGQDPYHSEGQAHGLSFSVPDGVRKPPSLRNIYKEIQSDLHRETPQSGNLERWAKQGVLLLNATLTVEAHKPTSHHKLGWEQFTDAVIKKISDKKKHVVFLLWGKHAQEKGKIIDTSKHCVLTSPHPSPFSAHAGFLGCKHFSKTNTYLKEHAKTSIEW